MERHPNTLQGTLSHTDFSKRRKYLASMANQCLELRLEELRLEEGTGGRLGLRAAVTIPTQSGEIWDPRQESRATFPWEGSKITYENKPNRW